MLEDTINPICDHNQLRYLGYKLHRRGASDLHEITGCSEGKLDMPNVDLIFDTDDILLWARGGDEIWLVANECFFRVHAAVIGLVSLLYEWVRTVHSVLQGDSRHISFIQPNTE